MPSSLKLAETTIELIKVYIRANLGAALAEVWNDRNDGRVTLETPSEYFIYVPTHAYRRPAIIITCNDFNFRLPSGPNFINALARVNVELVVQDRDSNSLTIKTWRYQAALVKLLDNAELTTTDNSVKIVTKVIATPFSGDGTMEERDPQDPIAVFAKGVQIELDVEHYEKKV